MPWGGHPGGAGVAGETASGLTESICRECGQSFGYVFRGKARNFCDGCVRLRTGRARQRYQTSRKLRQDEPRGQDMDGVAALAIRSQEEVGEILGVTQQAIRLAERGALLRLKKLLLEPVRIYREPQAGLDFSYREMARDVENWRSILRLMGEETAESGDEEMIAIEEEFRRELAAFEVILRAGMDRQHLGVNGKRND